MRYPLRWGGVWSYTRRLSHTTQLSWKSFFCLIKNFRQLNNVLVNPIDQHLTASWPLSLTSIPSGDFITISARLWWHHCTFKIPIFSFVKAKSSPIALFCFSARHIMSLLLCSLVNGLLIIYRRADNMEVDKWLEQFKMLLRASLLWS